MRAAASRAGTELDPTHRTSDLKHPAAPGTPCYPGATAPHSWRSRKARTTPRRPRSLLRGRLPKVTSLCRRFNSGSGKHSREALRTSPGRQIRNDGAAALSDTRISGASETNGLAGIQQSMVAGMSAVAPGRCRRPTLVCAELSGRIHLLQLGTPHARGVADLRRTA